MIVLWANSTIYEFFWHRRCSLHLPTRAALGGSPRLLTIVSDDGGTSVSLSLVRASFFGAAADLWRRVVEWCASKVSTSARLGGMAQRGLADGRGVMDSRRVVALSGTVGVSMAA
jgi:hypothetical protein